MPAFLWSLQSSTNTCDVTSFISIYYHFLLLLLFIFLRLSEASLWLGTSLRQEVYKHVPNLAYERWNFMCHASVHGAWSSGKPTGKVCLFGLLLFSPKEERWDRGDSTFLEVLSVRCAPEKMLWRVNAYEIYAEHRWNSRWNICSSIFFPPSQQQSVMVLPSIAIFQ